MPQNQRPRAGDFTAQMKAKAAREQAQEVQKREGELSMANAAATEEATYGVFDPQTGERLNEVNDAVLAHVVEPEPAPGFGHPSEVAYSGKEPVESQVPVVPQRAERSPFEVARSPMVVIRVDQDIEKMTYGIIDGVPNDYNFKEGLPYRVPREVAAHLDERGLVRQWISQ